MLITCAMINITMPKTISHPSIKIWTICCSRRLEIGRRYFSRKYVPRFGPMNLRTDEPSDQRTFETITQWTIQLTFGIYKPSEQRHVGGILVLRRFFCFESSLFRMVYAVGAWETLFILYQSIFGHQIHSPWYVNFWIQTISIKIWQSNSPIY